MTTTFLAPRVNQTFFIPGSNTPANGAQLFCYAAGTTTKTTVYKDNAALTSWTNPIVLDSGGNLPSQGELWQLTGTSMKYVFAPANDIDPPTSAYATFDNIAGINDVTSTGVSEWIAGPTPTFISTTSFSLVGDQTATFQKGRRVKTTNSGGTVYSRITASAFTTLTTVTVVNDSSVLDTGLSAVSYGILSATNPSVPAILTVSSITVSSITVSSLTVSTLTVSAISAQSALTISSLTVSSVIAGTVPFARFGVLPARETISTSPSVGSWTTVNNTTLGNAAATVAIIGIRIGVSANAALTGSNAVFLRKTGSGLAATAAATQMAEAQSFIADASSSTGDVDFVTAFVELDSGSDFDYFVAQSGGGSYTTELYLIGYFK